MTGGFTDGTTPYISADAKALTWERLMKEGIDHLFLSRVVDTTGAASLGTPSAAWDNVNGLTLTSTQNAVAIYSRDAFRYPRIAFKGQMPAWTGLNEAQNRICYVGFENGGQAGNLILTFQFQRGGGNGNFLNIQAQNDFAGTLGQAGVSLNSVTGAYIPSTWNSALHAYSISVHKYLAIYSIDGLPCAFVTFAPNYATFTTPNNKPPYLAMNVSATPPSSISTLHEINIVANGGVAMTAFPIWQNFRVAEGVDIPALNLNLYGDIVNTTYGGLPFTGQTVASLGSITSLPLPIHGFGTKKINWNAQRSGSLQVQYRDNGGNWNSLDAAVATTGGTPVQVNIASEGVYARVVWTSTDAVNTSTISTAEFIAHA